MVLTSSACVAQTPAETTAAQSSSAVRAVPRGDKNSKAAHEQLVEKARRGGISVYFLGDSITRRWGATDYPHFLAHWKASFHGWNAGNFGWGGDSVENILWRIENGELDSVNPRIIVLLAGTNNIGKGVPAPGLADRITGALKTVVARCQEKAPGALVVLMGIFPRNDGPLANTVIGEVNRNLAEFADGKNVRYLNINDKLAGPDGTLLPGMSKDQLHLEVPAYEIWAQALKPIFREVLGEPAQTDTAPPPTGDPGIK